MRWRMRAFLGLLALVVASMIPFLWIRFAASGHLHDPADAPYADVIIVLGAEVEPGNTGPKAFLRGRLDTTAELIRADRAKAVLVSGDGNGGSGDETTVMTRYLTGHGVSPDRIVADPYGLDTHDSCVRAKEVYGIERALVVTQAYHLSRAVTLCRGAGIDAEGVRARCECGDANIRRNAARDYLAATKAAWDTVWGRRPAITSSPSTAITQALAD